MEVPSVCQGHCTQETFMVLCDISKSLLLELSRKVLNIVRLTESLWNVMFEVVSRSRIWEIGSLAKKSSIEM